MSRIVQLSRLLELPVTFELKEGTNGLLDELRGITSSLENQVRARRHGP